MEDCEGEGDGKKDGACGGIMKPTRLVEAEKNYSKYRGAIMKELPGGWGGGSTAPLAGGCVYVYLCVCLCVCVRVCMRVDVWERG